MHKVLVFFFLLPFVATKCDDAGGPVDDIDDKCLLLEALKDYKVCKHAISILLDYRQCKLDCCKKAVAQNILPEHWNKGRVTGKAKSFADKMKDDLFAFLMQRRSLANPRQLDLCGRRQDWA